jgi:hypothetical protein
MLMNARWLRQIWVTGLATLALLLGGLQQAKADILYGATGSNGVNGELYILNPATGGIVQDVGPLVDAAGNHYGLTGLAFQPGTGILYGSTSSLSPTGGGHLVSVNPATGRVTDIGSFGVGVTMSDITFSPTTGRLFGNSGASGNFFSINPLTGAATVIGPTGVGVTFGGGLAANAAGTVFGSPQPGPGGLFTYNLVTGQATQVATLTGAPLGGNINALAFDSLDDLFGVNNNQGSPSLTHLITINPVTGVITDLGPSVNNLDAIAFQPVQAVAIPEPASLALFSLGALGLVAARWLKRSAVQDEGGHGRGAGVGRST